MEIEGGLDGDASDQERIKVKLQEIIDQALNINEVSR